MSFKIGDKVKVTVEGRGVYDQTDHGNVIDICHISDDCKVNWENSEGAYWTSSNYIRKVEEHSYGKIFSPRVYKADLIMSMICKHTNTVNSYVVKNGVREYFKCCRDCKQEVV